MSNRFRTEVGDLELIADILEKFNPNHDEAGRFTTGTGMGAGVATSILERVKANGGLSVNMVDGSEPTSGYMVAAGTQYGATVSAADFYDPIKGPQILADYMKKNKSDLGTGKNYLGLWHNTEDGNVYLDVSQNIQSKSEAISAGQSRDQISIWDVANFAEIQTGGTGVTKQEVGSRGIADEYFGDDGFGNRSLRAEDLGQVSKTQVIRFAPGLKPIIKFNPYHDERGRFSTGTGYAQGGYTAEQTYRQNQMKGKGPTHAAIKNMIDNGVNTTAEKDAMLNSFREIYETKTNGTTTSGIKTTVETKLTSIMVGSGAIRIGGEIIDSKSGQRIGEIMRTFRTDGNGLQVEHDYLAIHHAYRDEYKGFGIGRKVITNSEAFYANIGLHKITVGTAWDGARTWARAGYDFNPKYQSENFSELLRIGVQYGIADGTNPSVPKSLTTRFNKLMKGMSPDYLIDKTTGQSNASYLRNRSGPIKFHPMTNASYPIPNDFMTLGYKKGAKTWVGKAMSYEARMKYQKIVNAEGYNIKTKPAVDRNADNLLFTDSPREKPVGS